MFHTVTGETNELTNKLENLTIWVWILSNASIASGLYNLNTRLLN